MIVVGLDPGSRATGIVVRDGDRLVYATVIDGHSPDQLADYITRVDQWVTEACDGLGPVTIAVEGVQAPNPYHNGRRQLLHPDSLIGTAALFGAIISRWPDAVVVPPGGHGTGPRALYPAELWGLREGDAGTGRLRHARAAWSVAGAAMRAARREMMA